MRSRPIRRWPSSASCATLGSAADANSIWEIEVARRAGFPPADIVFTGVGKAGHELERAVPLGLKAINVESAGELERVEALAARAGVRARVAIRINPDIDARSHPHISTGLKINKFGVPAAEARELIAAIGRRSHLSLVAVHVHVGSQITTIEPLRNAASFVADLAADLRRAGIPSNTWTLAAALGFRTTARPWCPLATTSRRSLTPFGRPACPSSVEPGRAIVGPAGVLVAQRHRSQAQDGSERVRRHRRRHDRADAAGAVQRLPPDRAGAARRRTSGASTRSSGPVCESSDVVGRDRELPPLEVGDLVAIRDAGAYGSAMASNYNRRPLPLEVLVDDGRWRVDRRRQTVDDLLALERESCMPGQLIAFEGLDQSGKQTQAEMLRDRLKAEGRKARLVSFPDYGTSIGEEIARALQGEREYGPDVMQLLYVANRYERKPDLDAVARWRADARVRSLHGVEHRLRRGAGARSRMAHRHAAVPAQARR